MGKGKWMLVSSTPTDLQDTPSSLHAMGKLACACTL